MLNALTCTVTAVVDNAETVLHIEVFGKFSDNFKNMSDYIAVFFCNISRRGDMLFGYYKDMCRRLRFKVVESEDCIILVNFV